MILCLPLDSRPCCYDFHAELAGVAGEEVLNPPLHMLGGLDTPADFAAIQRFTQENIARCDTLVVALDMLLYGGLVQSRLARVSLEEGLSRLQWLARLKLENPRVQIFVSSVILRLTITAVDNESLKYYDLLHRYCAKLGLYRLYGDEEAHAEAQKLKAQLPPRLLESFFAVRKRNHALNLRAVEMVAEGIFSRLMLLQEDCQAGGIQEAEQRVLEERIAALGVERRVCLADGADEGVLTLVAARLCQGQGYRLCVEDEKGHSQSFIALFEDKPFAYNISAFMQTVGFEPDDDPARAHAVLCVHTNEQDFTLRPRIKTLLERGLRVAVLDVARVNGSHAEFFEKLIEAVDASRLTAYSAWNTASNSLGTILCNIAAVLRGGEDGCGKEFLFKRFADDYAYQSVIRPAFNAYMQNLGVNVNHFHQHHGEAAELLKALSAPAIRRLRESLGWQWDGLPEFPWDRSFEARAVVKNLQENK